MNKVLKIIVLCFQLVCYTFFCNCFSVFLRDYSIRFEFFEVDLILRGFLVAEMVKNLPAMQENLGLIPGSGRSPEEGNGNPLQYSCLENPMDTLYWYIYHFPDNTVTLFFFFNTVTFIFVHFFLYLVTMVMY